MGREREQASAAAEEERAALEAQLMVLTEKHRTLLDLNRRLQSPPRPHPAPAPPPAAVAAGAGAGAGAGGVEATSGKACGGYDVTATATGAGGVEAASVTAAGRLDACTQTDGAGGSNASYICIYLYVYTYLCILTHRCIYMIVCMDVSLVHINMMYTCVGASRQKAEEMARQLAVKTRECEVLL